MLPQVFLRINTVINVLLRNIWALRARLLLPRGLLIFILTGSLITDIFNFIQHKVFNFSRLILTFQRSQIRRWAYILELYGILSRDVLVFWVVVIRTRHPDIAGILIVHLFVNQPLFKLDLSFDPEVIVLPCKMTMNYLLFLNRLD